MLAVWFLDASIGGPSKIMLLRFAHGIGKGNRICEEAVTNALKQARPTEVQVELEFGALEVHCESRTMAAVLI